MEAKVPYGAFVFPNQKDTRQSYRKIKFCLL